LVLAATTQHMSITVNAESWQASPTVHMACAVFEMLVA